MFPRLTASLALVALCAVAVAAANPQEPSEADTLLAQAMELHQAGDLMGAIEGYEAALKIEPNRPDIRSNLGAAFVRLGRFPEAIAQYEKALAVQDNPSIRFNLGLAFYKSNRIEDAIPALREVVAADPASRPAALLLADCLLQTGQDQEVIDLLTPREAQLGEDLAYAYVIGTALVRRGEAQRGQVFIDRIFKNGDSAEGRLLMGIAYMAQRDYPTALPELAKAVEMNPSLPSVHAQYGRALLGSGDQQGAAREFRRELERNPNDFLANLQLGILYKNEKRFDDAMLHLQRAEAVRPGDLGLRHAKAAVYLGTGEVERAREELEQVVKDAPTFVDAHVLLASAYYRLKRKEDGDRERQLVEKLTAEAQAKQPGAKAAGEAGKPPSRPPGSPSPVPERE
jgi:tetratricopeptide (TPR) repeat protein